MWLLVFHSINWSMLLALFPEEKYVYYFFVIIGISISYLVIQPVITLFITLKSSRLLSYVFSSLVVLLVLLISILFIEEPRFFVDHIVKITLQCLAGFGVGLIFYNGFQRLINKN